MQNANWKKARQWFYDHDERCRVWESKGIKWVLHHKDSDWKTDDVERYNEWNIEDLLPMTFSAHMVIHTTGQNNCNYGKHPTEETKRKISDSLKGHIPWNKDKPCTKEHKRKISEATKGKHLGKIVENLVV